MIHIIRTSNARDETVLKLDSAAGNHIDNGQYSEISAFEKNQFGLFEKWGANRILRTPPTPRYNCHGMTFAARRTGVYDESTIEQILKEDGYVQINSANALPGDVILYYTEDGDIEHSGILVSKLDPQMGVPQVVSKWGKYGEFIHWANNCPYSFVNAKYFRISAENEN